eukprot:9258519-Lingulodinium_polyedra.AAC.1
MGLGHMDNGFCHGRRREAAVTVVMRTGWRLRALGIVHVVSLKDLSNAFGITGWPLLNVANKELMLEHDVELGRQ